jgi:hypothetical protein
MEPVHAQRKAQLCALTADVSVAMGVCPMQGRAMQASCAPHARVQGPVPFPLNRRMSMQQSLAQMPVQAHA